MQSNKNGRYFWVLAAAVTALLPFLLNFSDFKRLFWFGDEIHLLSEMSHEGLLAWSCGVFAESFVPVFKLLWGGSVLLFHGSYGWMLVLVWLTHGINTYLLSSILLRLSFRPAEVLLSILFFGMAPSMHETLGWTVQWSAVLVTTFLLLGVLIVIRTAPGGTVTVWSRIGVLLVGFGAAFSFARGVLACAALSFLLYVILSDRRFVERARLALIPLMPAAVAALAIFTYSSGNHQHLKFADPAVLGQLTHFWANFYLMNPFFRLVSDVSPDLQSLIVCGVLKVGLVVGVLFLCRTWSIREQVFLATVLLFDLGNSILVSVGRYHEGAIFATSSRYQYESLLCLAPFVGVFLNHITRQTRFPTVLVTFLFLSITLFFQWRWHYLMVDWSKSRGSEGRRFFFGRPDRRPAQWWGLPPIISREEAERVIRYYSLH